jgi:hypothetical protein
MNYVALIAMDRLLAAPGGLEAPGPAAAMTPLVEVVMTPLDGSATAPPGEAHWQWAVDQLRLTAEQVGGARDRGAAGEA